MAIDMRHSKLTPEEAALLAGELKKPNWQSKNEGIHERVSFEDSIWGFDLAGGSYYKTPLRVVGVKKGSRAEKAGIRLGDKLKRINDIDTATLTIQEAHEIIIASGVHLKIAVSAPEDEEDAYFCYEDPVESGYDSDEERRLLEENIRKRAVHAKVSSYWSLQWPWVSKRRVIYRESNCFMVPSKYENHHKEKFPTQPFLRVEDDVVLQKAENAKKLEEAGIPINVNENNMKNSDVPNADVKLEQNGNEQNVSEMNGKDNTAIYENGVGQDNLQAMNGHQNDISDIEEEVSQEEVTQDTDDMTNIAKDASEIEQELNHADVTEDVEEELSHDDITEEFEDKTSTNNDETSSLNEENIISQENDVIKDEFEDKTSTINDETSSLNDENIISQENDVIKELLGDDDLSTDDDHLLDSILSDGAHSRRNNGEFER